MIGKNKEQLVSQKHNHYGLLTWSLHFLTNRIKNFLINYSTANLIANKNNSSTAINLDEMITIPRRVIVNKNWKW